MIYTKNTFLVTFTYLDRYFNVNYPANAFFRAGPWHRDTERLISRCAYRQKQRFACIHISISRANAFCNHVHSTIQNFPPTGTELSIDDTKKLLWNIVTFTSVMLTDTVTVFPPSSPVPSVSLIPVLELGTNDNIYNVIFC